MLLAPPKSSPEGEDLKKMIAGEAKVSPSGGDLEGAESSGFLNSITLTYASISKLLSSR